MVRPFLRDGCTCSPHGSVGNKITSRFHEPDSMSDSLSHLGSDSFCGLITCCWSLGLGKGERVSL